MNIFYLDPNPEKCAKYHCDRHVVKMLLESAQLLSTTYWCVEPLKAEDLYKNKRIYLPTHIKHPSCRWVRKSKSNFNWLRDLIIYLNLEYKYRWGKEINHRSFEIAVDIPMPKLKNVNFTVPPAVVPEYIIKSNTNSEKKINTVKAYRDYYILEKQNITKWTKRKKPEWLKG